MQDKITLAYLTMKNAAKKKNEKRKKEKEGTVTMYNVKLS